MAYKDKIYDITALEMAKRLELFLNEYFNPVGSDIKDKETLGKKINKFAPERAGQFKGIMRKINDARNDIVHPDNLRPVLKLEQFKELQNKCCQLQSNLRKKWGDVRIVEVLSTLSYNMGNAGDIIKHGLLAEFVDWWYGSFPQKAKPLRFADPFAGCPWDNMYKDEIRQRVETLSQTAFGRAQTGIKNDMYYGSALLMRQAVKNCRGDIRISLSDNDPDALCNWENVRSIYDSLLPINLPNNDGYQILKRAGGFNLILLDPYAEFLRDEFYKDSGKHFPNILKAAKAHPNLFIAVFVLDMDRKNKVGLGYADFKRGEIADYAFSMRCPKRISPVDSRYDSEILLISQQIKDNKCGKLYEQLRHFARQSAEALPLPADKPLELWGAKQEGTPDNPEKFYREGENSCK